MGECFDRWMGGRSGVLSFGVAFRSIPLICKEHNHIWIGRERIWLARRDVGIGCRFTTKQTHFHHNDFLEKICSPISNAARHRGRKRLSLTKEPLRAPVLRLIHSSTPGISFLQSGSSTAPKHLVREILTCTFLHPALYISDPSKCLKAEIPSIYPLSLIHHLGLGPTQPDLHMALSTLCCPIPAVTRIIGFVLRTCLHKAMQISLYSLPRFVYSTLFVVFSPDVFRFAGPLVNADGFGTGLNDPINSSPRMHQ
ncbi:hypothetical protein BGZ60DRAFT_234366 [Tricladium varicosporioides]|nr:hypothetical protein BGZ60DRAFT_234366 [Hymenoscyphus varicosporioides]